MNKAVTYISGTTNETVNNMIVEVLERFCEKHEYEIVALLGENSQAGMSMPMKYSFIGMAEVEDIDAVKKLSQDVGIPQDLKQIVKAEDLDFLSQSAFDDACRPGNPRETSVEEIKELYKSLL